MAGEEPENPKRIGAIGSHCMRPRIEINCGTSTRFTIYPHQEGDVSYAAQSGPLFTAKTKWGTMFGGHPRPDLTSCARRTGRARTREHRCPLKCLGRAEEEHEYLFVGGGVRFDRPHRPSRVSKVFGLSPFCVCLTRAAF